MVVVDANIEQRVLDLALYLATFHIFYITRTSYDSFKKTANYDGDNKRFILIKHSLPTSRGKEVFRLKSFIKIFSCSDADQQPLQSHTRVTEKLIFGNQLAAISAVAVLPRRIINEVEMMTQH